MQLPDGHYWSEYVRTDDPFWNSIRSSLIGFVGIGPGFSPQFLGTGFVIGADDEGFILVLTAKHVVEYAAIKVQRPLQNDNAKALPGIFEPSRPEIGPMQMRAVWMGAEAADMPFVRHVAFAENLDVAVCVLEAQENLAAKIRNLAPAIALDTRIPAVGEWINIVTLAGLEFEGRSPHGDGNGVWRVSTRPVIRVGKIRSHEEQSLGHKARSFSTSIPTDGGMSGGFAYVPRDGQTVAACGIVSTSPKEDEGQSDFRVSGCSTCVGVLGALGLQVPTSTVPTFSLLFDLVKSGQIIDIAGPVDKLIMQRKDQSGACKIWRLSTD